jgi:mannan endo-1,4-beta-mannosidase
VRLWINGEQIIDDWAPTPFAIHRNGVVPLQASVPVTVKMEYFDTGGAASVSLRWSSRSQPLEIVPQQRLFPPAP